MSTYITGYEVHFARANRADQLSGLRAGAQLHALPEAAEQEAAVISHDPSLVPIVVPVRRLVAPPARRFPGHSAS